MQTLLTLTSGPAVPQHLQSPNSCCHLLGFYYIFTWYSDCQDCWVTSYRWCSKAQHIDLIQEGLTPEVLDNLKPEIAFTDW